MKKNENTKNDTTAQSIDVKKIRGAEWNTHRTGKDDEALASLVENIGQNNMIHRIAVRDMGDGTYEIIDGHRRFEAAKTLWWGTVPCEVHEGISDEEAQEMTLSANLQRIANDPLLEATCIEKLAEAGKTYEQIAARLGTDAKYVARRARLITLTEKWRGWFENKASDAADTMEMVAAHEPELQDEVYEALGIDNDGEVDHDDIERAFNRMKREIGKDTAFDTSACAKCPYNTATHGLLFGSEEPGRCQSERCFIEKWNTATDAKIYAMRKKNVAAKEAKQKWDVPNIWTATKNKTKKNTEPWVYEENGLKKLVWCEKKAKVEGECEQRCAMTEEEKAEAKRVKKAHREWAKNRREGFDKIRKTLGSDTEGWAKSIVEQSTFADEMRKRYEKTLERWISEDEAAFIMGVVGSSELGLTEEQYQAITSEDPAVEK